MGDVQSKQSGDVGIIGRLYRPATMLSDSCDDKEHDNSFHSCSMSLKPERRLVTGSGRACIGATVHNGRRQ